MREQQFYVVNIEVGVWKELCCTACINITGKCDAVFISARKEKKIFWRLMRHATA